MYGAMLIDKGTRTGVSILYVSVPRCSKRCIIVRISERVNGDSNDMAVEQGRRKKTPTLNWMESTGGRRLIESRLLASWETLPHF